MTTAVVVGPDPNDIGEALEAEGFSVTQTAIGNRPGLEEAGITAADVVVLTDIDQATTIPVAHDLNPDIRVVIYAEGSIPEFAARQTDLLVDPELLDAAAVAAELARED